MQPDIEITQQKWPWISLQLQKSVKKEIGRLRIEQDFANVHTVNDKIFLQPTVITSKKGKSVKIALDVRELNKVTVKNRNELAIMEHLNDLVAEQSEITEKDAWLTAIDIQYAYGKLPLDQKAA